MDIRPTPEDFEELSNAWKRWLEAANLELENNCGFHNQGALLGGPVQVVKATQQEWIERNSTYRCRKHILWTRILRRLQEARAWLASNDTRITSAQWAGWHKGFNKNIRQARGQGLISQFISGTLTTAAHEARFRQDLAGLTGCITMATEHANRLAAEDRQEQSAQWRTKAKEALTNGTRLVHKLGKIQEYKELKAVMVDGSPTVATKDLLDDNTETWKNWWKAGPSRCEVPELSLIHI